MSKTVAMNLLAAWAGTLSQPQDGDTFRETNTDAWWLTIANAFGYLKTAVDAVPALAVAHTWTALQTFKPAAGLPGIKIYKEVALAGPAFGDSAGDGNASFIPMRESNLTDADSTISIVADTYLIPQITGNRVYTCGSYGGNSGRRIRIVKRRTDGSTVTINGGSGVVGILAINAQGWMDLEWDASNNWLPTAWGSDPGGEWSSITTTV